MVIFDCILSACRSCAEPLCALMVTSFMVGHIKILEFYKPYVEICDVPCTIILYFIHCIMYKMSSTPAIKSQALLQCSCDWCLEQAPYRSQDIKVHGSLRIKSLEVERVVVASCQLNSHIMPLGFETAKVKQSNQ